MQNTKSHPSHPFQVSRSAYLRVSAQSTTNLICTHRNLAVLCTSESITCLFIVLSKVYDVTMMSSMMQCNNVNKSGVMKVFSTKT